MGRQNLSQFLITVDDALRALAEARSLEQLVRLASTAETLRRYAQRARLRHGRTQQMRRTQAPSGTQTRPIFGGYVTQFGWSA